MAICIITFPHTMQDLKQQKNKQQHISHPRTEQLKIEDDEDRANQPISNNQSFTALETDGLTLAQIKQKILSCSPENEELIKEMNREDTLEIYQVVRQDRNLYQNENDNENERVKEQKNQNKNIGSQESKIQDSQCFTQQKSTQKKKRKAQKQIKHNNNIEPYEDDYISDEFQPFTYQEMSIEDMNQLSPEEIRDRLIAYYPKMESSLNIMSDSEVRAVLEDVYNTQLATDSYPRNFYGTEIDAKKNKKSQKQQTFKSQVGQSVEILETDQRSQPRKKAAKNNSKKKQEKINEYASYMDELEAKTTKEASHFRYDMIKDEPQLKQMMENLSEGDFQGILSDLSDSYITDQYPQKGKNIKKDTPKLTPNQERIHNEKQTISQLKNNLLNNLARSDKKKQSRNQKTLKTQSQQQRMSSIAKFHNRDTMLKSKQPHKKPSYTSFPHSLTKLAPKLSQKKHSHNRILQYFSDDQQPPKQNQPRSSKPKHSKHRSRTVLLLHTSYSSDSSKQDDKEERYAYNDDQQEQEQEQEQHQKKFIKEGNGMTEDRQCSCPCCQKNKSNMKEKRQLRKIINKLHEAFNT